ncbi:MAG: peptidyl-alpha-hydroxyglycine alpha-amidating lyase family protein [Gemmatimonadota bacterium]|nr:peptidyl-alpha-hydroxyglycine alpha-amidating lyase family protein [Gemmatimonadota bacterium]
MRNWFSVVALFALLPHSARAQAAVPEIAFEGNINPLTLPIGFNFGEVMGVSLNSKKHLFVFSRTGERSTVHGASASQLFEFDATGKFLREIGKDLYGFAFAHTVRVDRDDNIWATDEGTNMIIKFNPAGRVTMVLGRREEAVEPAPPVAAGTQPRPGWGTFNRPADIAWDLNGNIFVADGYGNSRVVKIDKNGRWLKQWGSRGSEPGQFNILHTIASDARGNIYIGDRSNRRIQVFDPEGNAVRTFTIDVPYDKEPNVMIGAAPGSGGNPLAVSGAPWAICITPGPNQFLFVADAVPGRIYKTTLDGKVLGVLGEAGKLTKQFGWIHQIACPSEHELWVAEILNWRVQKLTLH